MFEKWNKPKENKSNQLCKHNNNAQECKLCKMSEEEARLEADMIKGRMIQESSPGNIGYKNRTSPFTTKEMKEAEGVIAGQTRIAAEEHQDGSIVQNSAEDKLQGQLELGEFVSSVEMQIHKLQECLKEVKNDPYNALQKYKYGPEAENNLKELGISWESNSRDSYLRVIDKLKKSKE